MLGSEPQMGTGTARRLRVLKRIVVAGVLVGIAYGILLHLVAYDGTLVEAVTGALIGAIHGLLISLAIGALEIFGIRTRLGQIVEGAPFVVTLGVKGTVYGAILAIVNVVEPGTRALGLSPAVGRAQIVAVIFSVFVATAFIFVWQISRIVGGRTLQNWVLGHCHRPRLEQRFFLFIDVVGSTPLAERLGPDAVHQFLNRVFLLASDPIDDHGGEIYQYVGDEMVITWTEGNGAPGARPLRCFAAIEAALDKAAPEFAQLFGVAPRVRGALHAGSVIVGEVGGSKRDIVFHGDVMNTTARLEQVARELERRLVVSADAMSRLAGADSYPVEDLGERAVRGRARPIQVYAVKAVTNMAGRDSPVASR